MQTIRGEGKVRADWIFSVVLSLGLVPEVPNARQLLKFDSAASGRQFNKRHATEYRVGGFVPEQTEVGGHFRDQIQRHRVAMYLQHEPSLVWYG